MLNLYFFFFSRFLQSCSFFWFSEDGRSSTYLHFPVTFWKNMRCEEIASRSFVFRKTLKRKGMAELSAKSRTSCRAWDVTRAHFCHCLLPLLLPQRGALLGSSVSLNRLQAHRVVGSVLGQASLHSLTNPYNYRYRFHLGKKTKYHKSFFSQMLHYKV